MSPHISPSGTASPSRSSLGRKDTTRSSCALGDPMADPTGSSACSTRTVLDGESSMRRVEPVNLVHLMRRWYLVGHDCDRLDWRTFRVDRIRDLTRTGHTFELDEIPDAARRVLEGIATLGRPSAARVLVDVEPDDARRRYSRFGTIEPTADGRSIVHMTADSLEQIARSIASMSCVWRILEPAELEDLVLAHGARIRRFARASRRTGAPRRG
jgi:predicted DNA-binding transcriptional regulator YafY